MAAHEYPWKRPAGWWLRNRRYLAFQFRELGGVVSALYGLILLNMIRQVDAGDAYTAFLTMMRTPPFLYVNIVLFALVVWHAVTWFMLIGKAQPIQFTAKPIPWKSAFALNVLIWIGVSGAVLYVIFGGP